MIWEASASPMVYDQGLKQNTSATWQNVGIAFAAWVVLSPPAVQRRDLTLEADQSDWAAASFHRAF